MRLALGGPLGLCESLDYDLIPDIGSATFKTILFRNLAREHVARISVAVGGVDFRLALEG